MGLWGDRLLPHVIDRACGDRRLQPLRERALAGLHGTVVELGFGSGLNVPLYPEAVDRVLAVEPSDEAWRMSDAVRRQADVPIERVGLDGASLDLADDSADCVLLTFTLCTIPDVESAVRESARVLRPGGTIHIAEHGLSPDPGVATWQHRLDGLQQRVFGGCHLIRDPRVLLAGAGFVELNIESGYVDGLPRFGRPWSYGYAGSARHGFVGGGV
ncbi:class I SAM-dependent methyltransferase [Nocardioides sp. Kera G14]|uniref:class I SAM-dependent methyltransferase n=1 Tax=Nocardioides sp. Kera G14 TaxID=2884264 RepID=UPI001D118F02|nr:class I SAM-dependent methyltransferase [Nocardioides sp. Kera G14]UDY22458.1 class I SAM-dependent methyltransferase [Nocardioides sp. Kera G14]